MELKPCPFCGGEAEVVEEAYDLGKTAFAVYCRGTCHVKLGVAGRLCEDYMWTPTFDTEAEAIAAWNTRAERTCRLRGGECDQCGAIVHEHANLYWAPVGDGMRTVECRDVHYCPNCGAKAVES